MRRDQRLILEFPDFSVRLSQLFQRLDRDPALLRLFAQDPSGVVSRIVFPDEPEPALTAINSGNRLLFSLLSNKGFMNWAREYTDRMNQAAVASYPDLNSDDAALAYAATISTDEVYEDVVEAALQFADREMLTSLLAIDSEDADTLLASRTGLSSPTTNWSPVAVLVLVFVVVVAVHAVLALGTSGDVARGALPGLSRDDLGRASRVMMEALSVRAEELRAAGVLASAAARRGTTI